MNPDWSKSNSVCGQNIVTTSQPLASEAGIEMLKAGGNAVDAALAAAICLTVVEPTGNGIGSDAFAILWDGQKLYGLNGSGRSPAGWTYEKFAHLDKMPTLGWDSVTVPGAVSVWVEMSERFGKLPFEKLFEPAIRHATDGYEVTPIAAAWQRAETRYAGLKSFAQTFLPNGRAPKVGEIFSSPDMASTLSEIAGSKGESFYRGDLARKIIACSESNGGLMTLDDLSAHQADFVTPVSIDYHGVTCHELPPNGQGLATLVALGILKGLDPSNSRPDSPEAVHCQIEAMKLGLSDIAAHLADPANMRITTEELLDSARLEKLARTINLRQASYPDGRLPNEKGTVCLAAADQGGMMVSFIQSNYMGFGSGVVIPGTGITMQNRGCGFSLKKDHPNCVAGRKRPYHTIIPGFVTRQGEPMLAFGLMGGHMQAQGHLQMMTRLFDSGLDPQTASDRPRWYLDQDYQLMLEKGFDANVSKELIKRGHRLKSNCPETIFGGAQLIYKTEVGYAAGSDHRKDGTAIGY